MVIISLTTASNRGDIHFIIGGAESTSTTSSAGRGGTTIGASLQENRTIIIPNK
jgi:hypothetical protein